jgi:hypothetical protein
MRTGRALALLLVALAGCDAEGERINPDKGHKEANGKSDPCHL